MHFPIQTEVLTIVNTFSWNLAHADAEFDAISEPFCFSFQLSHHYHPNPASSDSVGCWTRGPKKNKSAQRVRKIKHAPEQYTKSDKSPRTSWDEQWFFCIFLGRDRGLIKPTVRFWRIRSRRQPSLNPPFLGILVTFQVPTRFCPAFYRHPTPSNNLNSRKKKFIARWIPGLPHPRQNSKILNIFHFHHEACRAARRRVGFSRPGNSTGRSTLYKQESAFCKQ